MTKTLVIPPTTGRRVLLFVSLPAPATPADGDQQASGPAIYEKSRPFDAGIAYVWSDDGEDANTINVSYADHAGNARSATSVRLYDRPQNEDDAHGRTDLGTYAVWMPYQFEQALRAQQPKVAPQVAPEQRQRPADVNMDERKLADGETLTDLGREKLAGGVENGGVEAVQQYERRQDENARVANES